MKIALGIVLVPVALGFIGWIWVKLERKPWLENTYSKIEEDKKP